MKSNHLFVGLILFTLLAACNTTPNVPIPSGNPNIEPNGLTDHYLPFNANETWTVTQGLHNTDQAIDLDRDGSPRPIRASKAGTIEKIVTGRSNCTNASTCPGLYGGDWYFGNYVVILHADGERSWYVHLSSIDIAQGASVNRGQQIGVSGDSGNAFGVHLHYFRKNPNGSVQLPTFYETGGQVPSSGNLVTSQNTEVGGSCNATYPAPPNGRGPGDPGTPVSATSPSVALSWQCVNGATSYGVYVSKEPYGAANLVVNEDYVSGTSFTIPAGVLQTGVKYRWNMISFSGTNYDPSQFSSVLYFQYNPATPQPAIGLSPAAGFTYPQVALGQFSDNIFTVRNDGGGTLNGNVSVAAPFSVVSGGSYSLGAGQSQNVTVRFTPTARQTYSQTVTFTGASGASAIVSGKGVAPVWQSDSSTLEFSAGTVGGNPVNIGFNVKNVGDAAGTFSISATNGFVPTTTTGTVAAGGTQTAQVTALACTTTGTQTGVITISGSGSTYTINASRVCNPAMPPAPASLSVTMSSNGRLFVSWPVSSGATSYSFAGTFDGQAFNVTDTAPQPSGSRASAVAQVVNNPTDVSKQGKQLCLQTKAVNAGGSSAFTSLVCATYQHYTSTGLSVQSLGEEPQLRLSLP